MNKFNLLKMTLLAVIMVVGSVAWGQDVEKLIESYESGLPTSYSDATTFSLSSGEWSGQANGIIRGITGVKSGSQSLQLRSQTGAQITTPAISGGVSKVSFWGSGSTATSAVRVSYSVDEGANWINASGSISLSSGDPVEHVVDINSTSDKVLIQFYRTAGTVYIDDVRVFGSSLISESIITVNPTSVSLTAEIDGLRVSQDINVSALKLSSAITAAITGTGASQFSVNPTTLTKDGGVLKISYSPSNEVATHTAILTLSSEGAENVEIELGGATKEVSLIVGNETFETQTVLTGSYASGFFNSETGNVTVNYANSRDEGLYPINGKGIILRYADSYVDFVIPDGGVGTFNFKYRKAFIGSSERQIEVVVNETRFYLSPTFGTSSEEEVDVYDASTIINIAGAVTVRVKNVGSGTTNKQITIDDVNWTGYVSTDPLIFVNPTSLDFGSVEIGSGADAKIITVTSQNLSTDISAVISGVDESQFDVSSATINEAGELSISYTPSSSAAIHSAILTLSSPGATDVIVNLSGETTEPLVLEGDGTLDNPYTITDVKALNNSLGTANKYWVKGFVIGVPISGDGTNLTNVELSAPFSRNTAIALSDLANETDLSNMLGVQLPSGDVRTTLNLEDNVDL